MSEQNPNNVVDEYIALLSAKLNETTQENLVLKARMNILQKERDALTAQLEELNIQEKEEDGRHSNQTEEVGNSFGGAHAG
jgi:hypothetical protein